MIPFLIGWTGHSVSLSPILTVNPLRCIYHTEGVFGRVLSMNDFPSRTGGSRTSSIPLLLKQFHPVSNLYETQSFALPALVDCLGASVCVSILISPLSYAMTSRALIKTLYLESTILTRCLDNAILSLLDVRLALDNAMPLPTSSPDLTRRTSVWCLLWRNIFIDRLLVFEPL